PWIDHLPRSDAFLHRLHSVVHHRRLDWAVFGDAGHRHSPARHVFRRRSLPLCDGGRDGDGLLRRAALLVAEDDRANVLRLVEPNRGVHHHRRVLLHIHPAVLPRLSRDAAALPELSAGVPVLERDVHGWREYSGHRLSDAGSIPDAIAVLWEEGD